MLQKSHKQPPGMDGALKEPSKSWDILCLYPNLNFGEWKNPSFSDSFPTISTPSPGLFGATVATVAPR